MANGASAAPASGTPGQLTVAGQGKPHKGVPGHMGRQTRRKRRGGRRA